MADQSAPNYSPNWQFIPPNSGPLPPNTKVITTNHTRDSTDDLDIVERLIRAQLPICFEAAQLITWIRQERDEARLGLLEHLHPDVRQAYADAKGWDCFKDNTNG